MTTSAQETPSSTLPADDQISKLGQQQAVIEAETAVVVAKQKKLAAESALTAQAKADDAAANAQAAREKAWVDAANTLAAAAKNVPSGDQSVSKDFVPTPASTELSMQALGEICVDLNKEIGGLLQGKTVVFVDTIPAPVDTFALMYFRIASESQRKGVEQLATEAQAAGLGISAGVLSSLGAKESGDEKLAIAALAALAPVVAALPAALNTLLGFFRADIVEHVGVAPLEDETAAAMFSKVAGLDRVYPSVNAAAYATMTKLESLEVVKTSQNLMDLDQALGFAVDEITRSRTVHGTAAEKLSQQAVALTTEAQAAKTQAAQKADDVAKTTVLADRARLEAMRSALEAMSTDKARQAREAEAQSAVEKTEADKAGFWLTRFTTQKASLDSLINELSTAGADKAPRLVELIREELAESLCFPAGTGDMASRAQKSALRLVSLKIVQKPQSTVQKTFVAWKTYHASALLSLEYRVAMSDGRVIAAGVVTRSFAKKLRSP